MRIDIIFLDLDGTLLRNDKTVSDADKNILWDLYNSGVKVGYVTSRTGRKISELIKNMPCDFIAENNGSVVTYFSNNEKIHESQSGFDGTDGVCLLDKLLKLHRDISAVIHPFVFWNREISRDGSFVGDYESLKCNLKRMKFQRIRVYDTQCANIDMIEKANVNEIDVRCEGRDYIFEPHNIDKGKIVRDILSYYSINSEYAVAFGDSSLDIPMFNECSISVAMGNAPAEVKTNAKYLTKSNDESGVAFFLMEHFGLHSNRVKSSFCDKQCICLLSDVGKNNVVSSEEKRKRLSEGYKGHEVLAYDYKVSDEEYSLFERLTEERKIEISRYVGTLSEALYADVGEAPVLVSLARGGTIYGALCKYYLEHFYDIRVAHYTVSLVRGVGLDTVALKDIIKRHGSERIRFIDGWTGSGLIASQLKKYVHEYNVQFGTKLSGELAVVCDVLGVCKIKGTDKDILLPDSCLNATVCGLISSIYISSDYGICRNEYHGATVWENWKEEDHTQWYYDVIVSSMEKQHVREDQRTEGKNITVANKVINDFKVINKKNVRLGIGEGLRAIFRNNIAKILVSDIKNPNLEFIISLANKKGISVQQYDTEDYSCITLIKE